MRIKITAVLDPGQRLVRFESEFGSADAHLGGQGSVAEGEFDVELDVTDEIVDWKVTREGKSAIVGGAGGLVQVVGKVVSVDAEDKVAALRVGGDVLLVEVIDVPADDIVGLWMSEIVRELHLYDLNL